MVLILLGTNPPGRALVEASQVGYKIPLEKEILTQLYPTHDAYVQKVKESVEALVRERLIIQDDGLKIIKEAEQAAVP